MRAVLVLSMLILCGLALAAPETGKRTAGDPFFGANRPGAKVSQGMIEVFPRARGWWTGRKRCGIERGILVRVFGAWVYHYYRL